MSLNTPSHSRAKFTECDTVSALFAAQAERRSEAIAVSCRGETLTYGELAVRANQLAWYLRRHGVGPEVRVGVCVERSPAMVVALLGIVQAGGAYVPLDPGYPAARLRFMLTDAGVSVLVTETALTGTLGSYDGVVVCLDRDAEIISRERAGPVPESAGPDNLAYVIYTSGSTGMPKGVAVMHRSTVALLDWAREVFSPEELRGILASTSICFDISVFELFVPLCCGGRVILAENLLQLGTLPEANEIMLVNTVPSVLNGYLQVGRLPVSVRTVSLAGEPLPRALVQRLYEIPSIKSVFNLYGPSEDTVFSTFALSSREDEHAPPIGRPVTNTDVYVLDKDLTPVPVGVVGELYIGGAGLARGYLGRPALTAERFIPHPYSTRPGARLYRTGDLVRYRPDGNLEFLGRGDHQVKVRGFRIELGEIEAALAKHPAVGACVVVAREDTPGEKQLVAYVVTGGAPEAEPRELREYLQERLPSYMVPTAFVQLAALPVTSNGKLDRRALPAPLRDRDLVGDEYVAPRTSVETVLAGIWAEVLGLERVGVHDNRR